MKKIILYLTGVFVITLIVLFWFRLLLTSNPDNNFKRNFINYDATEVTSYSFPPGIFWFAGNNQSGLFFQNMNVNDYAYSLDYNLTKIHPIKLNLKYSLVDKKFLIRMQIVNNHLFVVDRTSGNVDVINLIDYSNKFQLGPGFSVQSSDFQSNPKIFIVSSQLSKNKPQKLISKVDYELKHLDHCFVVPYQKGKFSDSEGFVMRENGDSRVYFNYYFKGVFLCLDSNLNLIYQSKTIDTVTRAYVANTEKRTEKINGKLMVINGTPPKTVSRNSIILKGYLYNMSALKADNENSGDFSNNQVVDVYNCSNGKYNYSFYIPNFKNRKAKEFRIVDQFLYANYDNNFIVKYSIRK